MMTKFECDEVEELQEYVGCKVEYNKNEKWLKLTQLVLLQSYSDKFDLPDGRKPNTPQRQVKCCSMENLKMT